MKRTVALAIVVLVLPALAWGQVYPTKVITIIAVLRRGTHRHRHPPRRPGDGKTLGQQIIVENVGGAGGTIGATRAAKAAPDGYTPLLHHIGMANAPALYRKLPYRSVEDFEPIGLVTDVPMTLVAKDFPAKDLKELIAYVKKNKDKVSYANAGLGAASHLCGMLFMSAIDTDLTTVPYKGTGPAMNDLLGGQVDFMCDQTTNTTSQIKAGKIKVYGVTTKTRVPSLPDADAARGGAAELRGRHLARALRPGTPKAVVEKLAAALQEALKDNLVRTRFAELGTEPVPTERARPDALRKHLAA